MIMTFGLVFPIFNTGFGLDSVMLSWAIMLPRLTDAILDPTLGHFSDNLRTKWGRRKPILLITAIIGALLVAGIWWVSPAWPQHLQFVYLIILATCYYCVWGTFSMSHTALGYELTDDYHERSRLIAIRAFFVQIVTLIVSYTYWMALNPVFRGEINGIRIISGVFALAIVAFTVPVLLKTKERFTHPSAKHSGIFKALMEALHLKPFRTYLLMRFFSAFGGVIFSQMCFYVNVYYVCGGNKTLATQIIGLSTTLTVLLTLLLMPFVPMISRKVGKRRGFILGAGLTVFQAVMMPLLFTPQYPYLQLIAAGLTGPIIAIGIVLRDAIVPDICDLDEVVNGKRREGLLTAAIAFVYKMEVSLCVLIVGYMISWSKFLPNVSVQAPDVISRLQWFTFAPNIIFALLAFYFALRFSITEESAAENSAILLKRRQTME
jgi:GPH family glycoside/pentoside/hexuronide:cation symporter